MIGPEADDRTQLKHSLWAELGLPDPEFRDEQFAPEVDRHILLRLARRELPEDLIPAAHQLIHAFASWNDAYLEILVAEYHRRRKSRSGQQRQSREDTPAEGSVGL